MVEIRTLTNGKLHITTESGAIVVCEIPTHKDGEVLMVTDKVVVVVGEVVG